MDNFEHFKLVDFQIMIIIFTYFRTNGNSIETASAHAHVAQEGNGHAIQIENGHIVEHENRWRRFTSWISNIRGLPEPHNSPLLSRASSQHDTLV